MAKTQTTCPGLFQQWFPEKRWYRMVMCRRGSPLTLGQRLLYSYAWYRTKYGGTRMAEAARATGLDQGRTVPQARDEMIGLGLLTKDGNGLAACPPPEKDWFVWWQSKKNPGQPRLGWYPICHTPECWTVAQTAVYFSLLCNNVQAGRKIRHHQKKAGVAAMLGVSHDTVERAWRVFESQGLLEYDYLRPPRPEVLALFPDRPKKNPAAGPWTASMACGWPFGTMPDGPEMARFLDQSAGVMLKRGYTQEEVLRYWEQVRSAAETDHKALWWFMANWRETFDRIDADTQRNRADGKFKGRNSFGLLLEESRRRVGRKRLFGSDAG